MFLLLTSAFVFLGWKLRMPRTPERTGADYELLLQNQMKEATKPCEQLLHSIDESKSIAEKALAPGVEPEEVRHAMQDILVSLSRAVDQPHKSDRAQSW